MGATKCACIRTPAQDRLRAVELGIALEVGPVPALDAEELPLAKLCEVGGERGVQIGSADEFRACEMRQEAAVSAIAKRIRNAGQPESPLLIEQTSAWAQVFLDL